MFPNCGTRTRSLGLTGRSVVPFPFTQEGRKISGSETGQSRELPWTVADYALCPGRDDSNSFRGAFFPSCTFDPSPFRNFMIFACRPSLFKNHSGLRSFPAPAGAREQRRTSRNHKAAVLPWGRAGPEVSASFCGIAFGFMGNRQDPDRCFRESRRRPRAPFQAFPSKTNAKSEGGQAK